MRVVLCCGKSGCPAVEFKESCVEIGEADHTAKLTAGEWNLLVEKIRSGELGKI